MHAGSDWWYHVQCVRTLVSSAVHQPHLTVKEHEGELNLSSLHCQLACCGGGTDFQARQEMSCPISLEVTKRALPRRVKERKQGNSRNDEGRRTSDREDPPWCNQYRLRSGAKTPLLPNPLHHPHHAAVKTHTRHIGPQQTHKNANYTWSSNADKLEMNRGWNLLLSNLRESPEDTLVQRFTKDILTVKGNVSQLVDKFDGVAIRQITRLGNQLTKIIQSWTKELATILASKRNLQCKPVHMFQDLFPTVVIERSTLSTSS